MNMKKRIKQCFSLLLFLLIASCAVTRSVDNVKHSLLSRSQKQIRDSVFIYDSVIVHAKADTVYKHHWKTLYRDRISIDTVLVTDTIYRDRIAEQLNSDANDDVSAKSIFRFASLVFLFVVLWKCGLLDVVSQLLKQLFIRH